jgi:hypothetical protein
MYRGKKTFRYFNNRKDYESDCISNFISEGDFIVQRNHKGGRDYIKFDSCESFYVWYLGIPQSEKSFFEVIRDGKQKFRVDIDYFTQNIDELVEVISRVLENIGIKSPALLAYSIRTSYHIVLTNYIFPSSSQCKFVASILRESVNIDMGIYNKLQHFRIEGCTKYGELRWKERLEGMLNIDNFHEGIIGSTHKCTNIRMKIPYTTRTTLKENGFFPIPEGFSIRWKSRSLVVLDRRYPSYCHQCMRIHDKENAFIVKGNFYCRRKYYNF